jgi:hypothetical protein
VTNGPVAAFFTIVNMERGVAGGRDENMEGHEQCKASSRN